MFPPLAVLSVYVRGRAIKPARAGLRYAWSQSISTYEINDLNEKPCFFTGGAGHLEQGDATVILVGPPGLLSRDETGLEATSAAIRSS